VKVGIMAFSEQEVAILRSLVAGDCKRTRELLVQHPELLNRDLGAGTWLHLAAKSGQEEIVRLLLELGCNPNAEVNNSSRDTPLFCALVQGSIPNVKALLEHGADANLGGNIRTAVLGDKQNSLEFVKLMERHGADLHREFPFAGGKIVNALSLAITYGKSDVVEYLRSKGAVLPGEQPAIQAAASLQAEKNEVVSYFEKHVGPVDPLAQIEIVPTEPAIAIHVVPPAPDRPYLTLFTTGMSEEPMEVPAGEDTFRYAELFIQLPPDWKYRQLDDPNFSWPIRWLRSMAQYPHIEETWLGGPVTIVANEDPLEPLAPNVKFTSLLLLSEKSFTASDGRFIRLYRMMPLYSEERDLEIREGIGALLRRFDQLSVPFVVDLNRTNVATAVVPKS
jgi:Suppressor of fused protein (SUFU)/Ankyrin repeats (3 copies)